MLIGEQNSSIERVNGMRAEVGGLAGGSAISLVNIQDGVIVQPKASMILERKEAIHPS